MRVNLRTGSNPILLVAPHGGGPSDIRSAMMTEYMAKYLDAYAVINVGWVRRTKPKYKKSKANCNNLDHCRNEPLRSEFLRPIYNYRNQIVNKGRRVNLFLIHGMDDTIRQYNGINMVLGYGQGNPDRISCTHTFRDRLMSALTMEKFETAYGKSGGRLSAWSSNNLNQMFSTDDKVDSIQIEAALTLRDTDQKALATAHRTAMAIANACDRRIMLPRVYNVREI